MTEGKIMRKYQPTYKHRELDFDQDVYRFENGFGVLVTHQRSGEYEFAIVKDSLTHRSWNEFFKGNEITGYDAVGRMGSERYDEHLEGVLDQVSAWPADKVSINYYEDEEG